MPKWTFEFFLRSQLIYFSLLLFVLDLNPCIDLSNIFNGSMFYFNDRWLSLKAALVSKSNKIKTNLNGLWSSVSRCAHQPHRERDP